VNMILEKKVRFKISFDFWEGISFSNKTGRENNRTHRLETSRDSAVGIAIGYGLDNQGVVVQVPMGARIVTSPQRPDRLWGPPSLLSNGYRGLFTRG
jgi:hypothetical protein